MKTGTFILTGLLILSFISCKNAGSPVEKENTVYVRTQLVTEEEYSDAVRTSGRLSVESEQKLSFRTGGIIKMIYIKEGQEVKKGQALAELNLSEIQPQVNIAREAFEKAKRDLTRAENLYNDSVATLELYQDARTAYELASSNLQIAEFNLKYSVIEAPANGRILKTLAEKNEIIAPGYPVILFGSLENLWVVKVNVSDKDVVRIEAGNTAKLFLDPYPDMVFHGEVSAIAGMADPYSGMYEVEIRLTKTNNKKMAAGFIAKAEIIPVTEKLIAVPVDAVFNSSGTSGYIYRLTGNTAEKKRINIIHITNERIYTDSELVPGEMVITEGMAYLNGNLNVKVDTTGFKSE
jgi:RND family efflux transporter MFP subunit